MILVLNIECSPSFILGQGNLQFVALAVIAKLEFYSIKISPFYLFFSFVLVVEDQSHCTSPNPTYQS